MTDVCHAEHGPRPWHRTWLQIAAMQPEAYPSSLRTSCDDDHTVGRQAGGSALDVHELLSTNVSAEARFRDHQTLFGSDESYRTCTTVCGSSNCTCGVSRHGLWPGADLRPCKPERQ